ncbi:hypothetical protein [Escherichia coli]|jgi:hypothetical protein|nr:hypothetical protein [Escherichia coli]MDT3795451.1 hypothetical protein [Escherichia coli]
MIDLSITMYAALGFVGFILTLCGTLYVNADRLERWAGKRFRLNQ